ncbi:MBOAT family protein [Dysgonomonas sp. 216]|uniref:MBOAT family O-acyltransferase n=1 Tax=Dysgonomonas sp. 216 TaxID=2302934 RepID=UPI0013D42A89|nr:MBOAT family protein [Dysgonomonas sp. 216]NDW19764.1 MBOAT family protein [Dysgonomonas sp. 216]
MLFTSFIFVALVIVTFFIYYFPKCLKYQPQILTVASFIFYAYNEPILLFLLLSSILINSISSYYVTYGKPKYRKLIATTGVVVNLFLLAFFKYTPLLVNTFDLLGTSVGDFLVTIPLPIGISFFTFQGISLLVDTYKENYFKAKDIVPPSFYEHAKQTFLFISIFPQLIAGPIVKAHEFLPQIKTKYIKDIDWEFCFKNVLLGYFLKMVIADNLKDYTFIITYPHFEGYHSVALLVTLLGYSCQIFADFAGYSLIAIGLSATFGYKLRDNFNFPYISTSFKEFWKRWHISLSSFLMEYLYIPLGGNRKGRIRTYFNLFITMLLGGLWHGAAWSYVIWGGFHGLALCIERVFMNMRKSKPTFNGFWMKNFKRILIFTFVSFAWLLFKLPEFNHVIKFFQTVLSRSEVPINVNLCSRILMFCLPIFIYHMFYLLKKYPIFNKIKRFEYVFYAIMLFLICTSSGSAGAFIYFQF